MAWSTGFEAMMPDTITVSDLSSVSTDGYGTITFTTGASYTARIVHNQHLVRTPEGIEETARTVVYIASTSTFAPSAQFTMPDGSTPELMAIQAFPDADGIHHLKASFR